jgi:ligand-binding sensor domain-containing protein
VLCGLADKQRRVWLGLPNALLVFDEESRLWSLNDIPADLGGVHKMYCDRLGRLWLADISGKLAVKTPGQGSWRVISLGGTALQASANPSPGLMIDAIYQDKLGQMFFATDAGLIVYREKENSWAVLNWMNSSLPSDIVTTIFEDTGGRIWLGVGSHIMILEP